LIFRTKPELALGMLADAVTESVSFRWVGSDSIYGNSPAFVQGVRQLGKWYVLDISSEAHVWTKEPLAIRPEQQSKPSRGRPYKQSLAIGT
jgi:SRSO17 transposase